MSVSQLKLINHDVKGLSKYTSVIEVIRTEDGLKSLPLRPYIAYQSHHNLEKNKTINTRFLSDTAKLLKHCSVLKAKAGHPKRAHFSLSTVHTDSNESNKAECANFSSCFSNSGETSRHGSSDVSATTPALSLVAKAPIPPEPPPFKLKVLLIGAGVCTERHLSLTLPLEVVRVIEIGEVIEHARKSFPNA